MGRMVVGDTGAALTANQNRWRMGPYPLGMTPALAHPMKSNNAMLSSIDSNQAKSLAAVPNQRQSAAAPPRGMSMSVLHLLARETAPAPTRRPAQHVGRCKYACSSGKRA